MNTHYTLLDHTADLRIRVSGRDPAELYKNAGLALFDLIYRSDSLESRDVIEINITGDDPADLMVNYLRELLFLWTGNEKLVTMVDILQISDTVISARVSTGRYQPQQHTILHEIKAVTYHQIEVSQARDGWQAMVVFDV
jgi:SHS2 domain-containing protein